MHPLVFRTESIKDVRFDDKLPWAADWKFCIDLSKQTEVYYFDAQSKKLSSLAVYFDFTYGRAKINSRL